MFGLMVCYQGKSERKHICWCSWVVRTPSLPLMVTSTWLGLVAFALMWVAMVFTAPPLLQQWQPWHWSLLAVSAGSNRLGTLLKISQLSDTATVQTLVCLFSSVSIVSDSLGPHRLHHARLPCPSPIPRVYSNSCPLSQWCLPTIWSSFVPFSSYLQSFPASGSFPMSQFFAYNLDMVCLYQNLNSCLLTFLRFSMGKSKISLGKCHIALENTWVIFKYLLIMTSSIISQR